MHFRIDCIDGVAGPPRLPHLRAALRDVDISVTALEEPPDLKRTPFDLYPFYAEPGPDRSNCGG
ncbi:hypothetical protein [Rhizobium leguminosarum]|uniref:hypothetical protein n=1 Tax=Rhizobium leguminosarum TaxID=384 RepID=UPI001AE98A7C|nr:hypothetical protein [Rhizobium leguminosarum]MBP2446214.1 hypothetical protein [Rhizobium leguminosarum]